MKKVEMLKWIEISECRPAYGQWIWVWDTNNQTKLLIRYFGSEDTWRNAKENSKFPVWAHLNNEK